ncbi:MAG: DUF937 domain-containing protein [Hyphomicrobium sp.]
MNIKSLLNETPGAAPAQSLATAFGVDPEKAGPAIDMLAQSLADRIERNTLSRGGIADLVDLLARPGAGKALAEPQSLSTPQVEQIGNSILNVLIGSKHNSRGIAAKTARATGVDEETLKKMLPAVASMVIGALQNKSMPQIEQSLDAIPDLKAKLAGSPLPIPGERRPGPSSRPAPFDIDLPQSAGGGRSSTGGGGMGGSPLPSPGVDIPGLDGPSIDGPSRFPQLPDVIRRGGTQVPGPSGGGALEDVIRQILANVLGFKNTGILAWILKIVFSRWFMGLLARILFRR